MLARLPDGLRAVRTLHAPRAAVWEAWVDPARLRAWWGPPGIAVPELEGDLRVGGSYRIVMEGPDGERRVLVWSFREIVPPERLAFDWQWVSGPEAGAPSRVTVELREVGDRTEVEITHSGLLDAAIRDSHATGWVACLDGLDETLNQMV